MTREGFQPGDTVELKSGGPDMTVRETTPEGDVICEWFDRRGAHQLASFMPETLQKPDPLLQGTAPLTRS